MLFSTREDSSKAIGLLDKLVNGEAGGVIAPLAEEGGGRVHVSAHPKPAPSLFGNGKLVAGDHLDVNTKIKGTADGLGTVMPRRIEEGQETQKLPWATSTLLACFRHLLPRHTKSTEAAVGKLGNHAMDLRPSIPSHVAELNDLMRGSEFIMVGLRNSE